MQIAMWIVIHAFENPDAYPIQASMTLILFAQYFLRMYLIFILGYQMIEATGLVTKTGFVGATYSVMLYLLGCHVSISGIFVVRALFFVCIINQLMIFMQITGSAWYLMMYNTQIRCWEEVIHGENVATHFPNFNYRYFSCNFRNNMDQRSWANSTMAFAKCDAAAATEGNSFDFGMFTMPLIRRSLSETFLRKYIYCLWWGLQNLGSYGQNLITSIYFGETAYASLIAVMGLVMYAHLIGKVEVIIYI